MKKSLHGAWLLLAFVAGSTSVSGQEYDERPRSERRPFVAVKPAVNKPVVPSLTPERSATNLASGVIVAADSPVAPETAPAAAPRRNDPPVPIPVALPTARVASISDQPIVSTSAPGVAAPSVVLPTASAPPVPVIAASVAVPTSIYRVGEGDVLDIRILNYEVQTASTLYTVQGGGLLEYPLVGEPLAITGLTTDDIDARLTTELKRREVFDAPQIVVSVREYVSHTANVTGLVDNPGAKVLRREALPLYVLLAEASPRAEAGLVIITSLSTNRARTIDLADAGEADTLVYAGDVVRVAARPPQFFYVGGEIGAPGQKDFHAGMTLTQAVLAAGGATRAASGRVRVARQGEDGRLVATEYSLREIEQGRVPDPALRAGDRIELNRK